MPRPTFVPIGVIRSSLKSRAEAPMSADEGAPNAFLEVFPRFRRALFRMKAGDEVIVLTWLHRAKRSVLRVHPRGDLSRPIRGVFSTRSPDRPNPVGLHRVAVIRVRRNGLDIGPIEAIDGTPVVDIKQAIDGRHDS